MRMMGLDYGSKTVGVAITDGLGMTAQPVETIKRKDEKKLRRTCARIEALIKEYEVGCIVLGRPLNMDDSVSERVLLCEEFKDMIERRTGLPVEWQDERLTTVEADEILSDSRVKRENRKEYIDQVAACIILEEAMKRHTDDQ